MILLNTKEQSEALMPGTQGNSNCGPRSVDLAIVQLTVHRPFVLLRTMFRDVLSLNCSHQVKGLHIVENSGHSDHKDLFEEAWRRVGKFPLAAVLCLQSEGLNSDTKTAPHRTLAVL